MTGTLKLSVGTIGGPPGVAAGELTTTLIGAIGGPFGAIVKVKSGALSDSDSSMSIGGTEMGEGFSRMSLWNICTGSWKSGYKRHRKTGCLITFPEKENR